MTCNITCMPLCVGVYAARASKAVQSRDKRNPSAAEHNWDATHKLHTVLGLFELFYFFCCARSTSCLLHVVFSWFLFVLIRVFIMYVLPIYFVCIREPRRATRKWALPESVLSSIIIFCLRGGATLSGEAVSCLYGKSLGLPLNVELPKIKRPKQLLT